MSELCDSTLPKKFHSAIITHPCITYKKLLFLRNLKSYFRDLVGNSGTFGVSVSSDALG